MKWISLAVLTAAATAAVLALSGCDVGMACNAMAPYCALTVELDHVDWEPGDYVFEASDGKEVYRCTATLPDPDGSSWKCESLLWGRHVFDEGPHPSTLALRSTPSKTTVRVLYGDQEIASKTFKPSYKETEPNGDGCGICKNANAKLEF